MRKEITKPLTAIIPFLVLIAILFSVLLTDPKYGQRSYRKVTVTNGSADLSAARDRVCELKGEWLFWWDSFIIDPDGAPPPRLAPLPGAWKDAGVESTFGHATYALRVSGLDPAVHYYLRVGQTLSACSVLVNGVEVRSIGTVGASPASERPAWGSALAEVRPREDGTVDVVIQISNYHDRFGGSNSSIYLGPASLMTLVQDRQSMGEGFLFAVLSVMGLFFLGLFLFRRKDRAFFWFACLALIVGFRTLCYDGFMILDIFPGMSWSVLFKLGYATFPLAMTFFVFFLHTLYPSLARRVVAIPVAIFFSAYCVLIVLASEYVAARTLFFVQVAALAVALWGLGVIVVACVRRFAGSVWLLVGFVFALLSFTYDILVAMWLIPGYNLAHIGMCVWLFCIALMVIARYAESFERARLLSAQLSGINASLKRFVPAEFLAFLKKTSITEIQPGDSAEVDMAILSADIRSFTSIAERMSPDEVFVFLNEYLELVGPIIRANGGFIAKYEGDGFFALFPNGADPAVRCAVQMQTAIAARNRNSGGLTPLAVGIGIDCGRLTLGTIGDDSRLDGTVISHCVKCAGRFESATKQFQSKILVNESVYAGLPNPLEFFLRPVDRIETGSRPSFIFEVYANDSETVRELKWKTQSDLEHALFAWFVGQYDEARAFIERVLSRYPDDPVALFYAHRLEIKDYRY
jgi:class 3 adenylate cyclase